MLSLTTQQNLAIQKTQGPCVILAGAGTGKTHTIVEKIKHLIQNKICPAEKIVCITFSNEAANSILARVQKSLPEQESGNWQKRPIIKTFHAFSADLLRTDGEKIRISPKFRILTPDEAKIILHQNLRVPVNNCHKYVASLGTAKDLGITLEQLQNCVQKKLSHYNNIDLEKKLENLQFEFQTLYLKQKKEKWQIKEEINRIKEILDLQKFTKAWNAYEKIKEKNSYQDYSDLNSNALTLLKKFPEISGNYKYIIVDEFQDTNKIQLELLFQLAPHKNITIVGDINQSIYRFRGAYNENYNEFKKHFRIKQSEIFSLDKSYRSTDKILKVAHELITNNYESKEESFEVKNAFGKAGEKIRIFELNDAKEEARKIVEIVEQKLKENLNPNELCVMFRTHQYGRIIKQLLEFKNIPYCAVGKSSLLKQNSVRTIINYLTILEKLKTKSGNGEDAWWDMFYKLNLLEKDIVAIGKFIKKNKNEENLSVKLFNELENLELTEKGKFSVKLQIQRIKKMLPHINEKLPDLVKQIIYLSGLIEGEEIKKQKEILLNLNKFHELTESYSSFQEADLTNFIVYLGVIKTLKIEIESPELETNGVRLMTSHATKGLEYDTVIITNLAQKRFPMEKFTNNPLIPLELSPEFKDIEEKDREYLAGEKESKHQLFEERRLCYVAFTRAKNNLILTYAKKYNSKEHFPSQFLSEIKYKQNQNCEFLIDAEEKYLIPELKIKSPIDSQTILSKDNFENFIPELQKEKQEITFSPSSLLLFSECQKKFEYKYIYSMPEEKSFNWEALKLGNFVHTILDKGVKENFSSLKQFTDLAKEMQMQEEWETIGLEEAEHLIKVFYERNKNKYSPSSKTEQILEIEIEGLKFKGFADRIDKLSDGSLEIIDYKTGASNIQPKHRNWQLGFYALAASKLGKVKKMTLEMLKQEKPLEFTLDENGNAKAEYSNRMEFNINEIKKELTETARQILQAQTSGFQPCSLEKNCDFCNEFVYGN